MGIQLRLVYSLKVQSNAAHIGSKSLPGRTKPVVSLLGGELSWDWKEGVGRTGQGRVGAEVGWRCSPQPDPTLCQAAKPDTKALKSILALLLLWGPGTIGLGCSSINLDQDHNLEIGKGLALSCMPYSKWKLKNSHFPWKGKCYRYKNQLSSHRFFPETPFFLFDSDLIFFYSCLAHPTVQFVG